MANPERPEAVEAKSAIHAHDGKWSDVANEHNASFPGNNKTEHQHHENQKLEKLGFPQHSLPEHGFDPRVRDLKGNFCKTQPTEGRYPVLESGKKPTGCNFKDLKEDGPSPEQYKKERGETPHIRVLFESHGRPIGEETGSGVMLGKAASKPGGPADTCLVATDNHVVQEPPKSKIHDMATFVNGEQFDAKKILVDKASDISVIGMKTGDKTDQVCRPPEFVDKIPMDGKGYFSGFPQDSNYPTISPLQFQGLGRRDSIPAIKHVSHLDGENMKRELLLTSANTLEGQSGAPLRVAGSSKVAGLLEGGKPGKYDFTFATPMTQERADDLVRRAQEKLQK